MNVLPNLAQTVCLRPLPNTLHAFMPLFEERNRVMEAQSDLVEQSFAAAAERNHDRYEALQSQIAGLKAHEDELTSQMREYQFEAWSREDANVVTLLGRNMVLDTFWRGAAYTQTVVMGLCGTGTKASGDTQSSHAGWLEVGLANAPTYTGNRKAVTMNTASSQAAVSPQQTFAITSSGTVAGLFMNNAGSATKDTTTGTLVSAVDFSGGNQAVINGDSLLVTYTFNA